ncbi:MAG TPA: helix-hairpin-helix domain-containing protein [Actinomycetes bacterium]|nr:helix-hairpin-helix domain-containing protein [Actinomycetes bacterium]
MVWALIPTLSFGLLACLPFAHAAVKLQNRRMWLVTASYAVATVVVFGPLGDASNRSDLGAALFTMAVLALIAGATLHAFLIRRRVFSPPALQPAMAAALADRKLRQQARAIAAGDPPLARELRIGRPDLPRQFDDGGLVDVNHVPEQVLVNQLGLSPAEAARVVEVRERLGGFGSAAELGAFAEIPDATIDVVRERLLFPATD